MSLKHEFRISENVYDEKENSIENTVSISDDLVRYMSDSLCWIQTFWNGKKEKEGLNYYGYTIIKGENVKKLRKVIEAWMHLFENSTSTIILTGDFIVDEDKYERIEVGKEVCLAQLMALEKLCVEAEKGKKAVLHEGI